jgi:phthiocerol/phenolphthiocerol synthesis type-I polyketide synthase C
VVTLTMLPPPDLLREVAPRRSTELPPVARRLRHWAATRPQRLALSFQSGSSGHERSFTYAELDRRARAVAAVIQERVPACEGKRAVLVHAPGPELLESFLGCLYAGVIAVPTYAPHPAQLRRSLDRFLSLARDADPELFLSSGAHVLPVRALAAALPRHWKTHCLDTGAIGDDAAARWREPSVAGDAVAFLQYTSGSTSAPKGVMVTHANLAHNLEAIERIAADVPEPIGVSWLPPYHDMGLIGGLLEPLWVGFPGTLLHPLDFLQRPVLWLETISRTRATVSPCPNFALELCLRRVTDEQLRGLDLSSWRAAINGAEPVRKDTLDRFTARFAPAGFAAEAHRPVYGLAEATLLTTCPPARVPPRAIEVSRAGVEDGRVAPPRDAADARALVSLGPSIAGQEVVVVDPETARRRPAGTIGEIWVRGPSVARGYWRKPEETERAFAARLAGGGEGPYLRTGDLGFLDGGELFVTGRCKDLIIVDGKNHYPQDLELAAERVDPAVRPGSCAAFSVDEDGARERVVLVAEVGRPAAELPADLADRIRARARAEIGVDLDEVVLIKRGTLPKTSSGKVQRFQCRAAYLAGKLARVTHG